LDFVKVGRQPWDPLNTTKVQMPPRGGNPMLSDDDLRDIIAYVRTLQPAVAAIAVVPASSVQADGAQPVGQATEAPAALAAASVAGELDPSLCAPRWIVSTPPIGPAGLAPSYLGELNRPKWQPPRDAVAFVNAYCMTAQLGGWLSGAIALVFAALL